MSSNTSIYLDYGYVLTDSDQSALQKLSEQYPSSDAPGDFSLNAINQGLEDNWVKFKRQFPHLASNLITDSSSGHTPGIIISLVSRHKEIWDKYAGLDGADFTIIEPKHDDEIERYELKMFRKEFGITQKPRPIIWSVYG